MKNVFIHALNFIAYAVRFLFVILGVVAAVGLLTDQFFQERWQLWCIGVSVLSVYGLASLVEMGTQHILDSQKTKEKAS